MSLDWTFEEKDGVLLVTPIGSDETLVEIEKYSKATVMEAKKRKLDLVLCDERKLSHKIPIIDAHESAKKTASIAKHVRKACLVVSEEDMEDDAHALQVWEDTINGMGIWVRVFRDMDEAWKWIKE